ncbi:drug/metabolite transporter (DMT)-like permease [Mesonia hippocampi]|uniref:Drug/metabolite transporter (DMT)-like permease n=1 Tax=Mesonia hippocampi TaxID=1628250 RepID=A0A840EP49_9FLAO|nr:DMT family transporter [Mesonia hippocampi]MBB4118841.1 drug/metabolite transporter (DMT)-like permease [Mesonia hippocampi]
MKNQQKAYIYAGLSVCIWATVASAFKVSLVYFDSLQLLFFSSITSILALFSILFFQKKIHLLKNSRLRDYITSVIMGFINPFVYYLVLFKAYAVLPAQEAQPLNYTWPIMLTLLSIPLLKQRVKWISVFAILISFIGVFIISTKGDLLTFKFSNLNGALLALSTAIIWALFWIFNIRDKRDDSVKLFLSFIFGFIYISIATFFFSDFNIPNSQALWGTVYIGLFEMGITFVLWAMALQYSETTAKVSKFIFLTPFLSLIVVYFVVGEKILSSTIIGLLFIVAGIILEQVFGQKKQLENQAA